MKKQGKWLSFFALLAVCCILLPKAAVYAKEQWITFTEGEQEITMTVGDTGKFEIPEAVTVDGIQKKVCNTKVEAMDYDSYDDSDYDDTDDSDYNDDDSSYNDDDNYDNGEDDTDGEECASRILKVDKEGNFTAVAYGKVEVTITLYMEESEEEDSGIYDGYDDPYYGTDAIQSIYMVTVVPDMTNVSIKNSSQTKYIEKSIWGYYDIPSYTFSLDSDIILDEEDSWIDVAFSSSNSKIKISGELSGNNIILYPSDKGNTTVTITICGKPFKVTIKTIAVGINKNSLLIAKGKSSKLKISGVSSGIKWSSSNKKIVTVSSNGTIKGKKTGNAVIKAKIGNVSLGCAVSVVTDNRLKIIKRASQIAKTCTYSQQKRMQSKYYDCSSLVWKAYSKYGQNFGNKSYAPVAADLGKWCANHKKVVKGGVTYNNVQKMKYNPGDLYFATGSNNGRYKGISHVEMISGYVCYGFNSKGKPILELDYVNRSAGKYYGGMVGQP